jgi:nitroreductase
MDALTAIFTRSSAAKLSEPAPSREQLEILLKAGAKAPDHGRLIPWRFVVLEGKARERLGDALARIRSLKEPNAPEAALTQERAKALRAPVVIAVAAHIDRSGRIPEIEQLLAVGAGVQNMLLAAHAMGLGAMWKTGEAAYDESVNRMLGLGPDDRIVAFLYLGTLAQKGQGREIDVQSLTTWL